MISFLKEDFKLYTTNLREDKQSNNITALNQLLDLNIIPSDHDCVISNILSSTNDTVKPRSQEMHKLSELHINKHKKKKDRYDQTISDINNRTKTLPSNNHEKEKNTINKIEMKDNSRYVSTAALKKIAKSTSLNVQHVI